MAGSDIKQNCFVYYFTVWKDNTKLEQGIIAHDDQEAWLKIGLMASRWTGVTRLKKGKRVPKTLELKNR